MRTSKGEGDQLPGGWGGAPPPSLPFLTFAAFLTLEVGVWAVTWVRREKRQRSK